MVLALRSAFCVGVRKDSDFCCIEHEQVGLYNCSGKCLQRGAKGSGEVKIQEFMHRDTTNVEPGMYDYTYSMEHSPS
jgi:hypothetical protein